MNIKKVLIVTSFLLLIPMLGWITPDKNKSAKNVSNSAFPQPQISQTSNQTKQPKKTDISGLLSSKVQIKIGDDIIEDTLEEYLIGVTAAEISPTYEVEAIKAQVIATHTYAVNRYGDSGPYPADPSVFQAYINKEKRQQRYKDNFENCEQILKDVIKSVADKIIVYYDQPIAAAFHSMSGGTTESSEDVWGSPVPYLVPADSSVETSLQNFTSDKSKNITEAYDLIKSKYPEAQMPQNKGSIVEIVSRTDSDYVETAKVFGVELSGTKIRSIFSLKSADFTASIEGDNIVFTCKGNGHGVGMSQYGANELAKQGKSYEEILCHYYTGVSIKSL